MQDVDIDAKVKVEGMEWNLLFFSSDYGLLIYCRVLASEFISHSHIGHQT